MSELINHYVDQHTAARANLAGDGIAWLDSEREQALSQFRENGFPGPRDEDWRYTPLRGVTGKLFEVSVQAPDAASGSGDHDAGFRIDRLDATRLVFVDGRFDPAASDMSMPGEQGYVGGFAAAVEQGGVRPGATVAPDQGFAALNLAFSADGYVISVKPGIKLKKPVEVLCIAKNQSMAAQPRNTISLGAGSQAMILERHVSEDGVKSLVNSTSRIEVGENASLDFYLVQELDNSSYQVTTIDASQSANSRMTCVTASLGGALVRNNLKVSLDGEGAHCDMLGVYNVARTQHVDNHTTVTHNVPHCSSHELYKGVLDQRSRAVFHGRIKVEPGAQKTDATQANHNLLLSANAEIDTKPQLEIYADDVKCAHGATVGQIDDSALFYLRSRGIDANDARALMTFAFVNEVLEKISLEPVRASLEKTLATRLVSGNLGEDLLES